MIVIFSIVLHELVHAYAALWQGDSTAGDEGHFTWNPIVHMGWSGIVFLLLLGITWGQTPVDARNFKHKRISSMIVAMAGPLSNLLLGVFFVVLSQIFSMWYQPLMEPLAGKRILEMLFLGSVLNNAIFLFNLIPIPPLDGYLFFREIFPVLRIVKRKYPYFGLIVLLILYLIPGFWKGLFAYAALFSHKVSMLLNF